MSSATKMPAMQTSPVQDPGSSAVLTAWRCGGSDSPEHRAWCRLSGDGAGLALVLVTVHHTLETDADGGVSVARHLAPLADVRDSDADGAPAEVLVDVHLWPAVRALARRAGLPLSGDFDDRDPLGPPDLAAARRVGPPDRGALAMLETYGRGVVLYDPSVDPERVAAGIAAAYPGRRILIVAATKRSCLAVTAHLRRAGVDAAWLRSGRPGRHPLPPVVVATPCQAPRAGNLSAVDLYVAVDAVAALGSTHGLDPSPRTFGLNRLGNVVATPRPPHESYDPLSPARPALLRRVGLRPADALVTPTQKARHHRTFGFPEAVVFAGGHEPPRVEVTWIPLRRPTAPPAPAAGDVSSLRHGIWTNSLRNRRLAAAARAEADAGSSVLVICGSPEQAARLARLLPGWNLRLTADADLTGMTVADRRTLREVSPEARGPLLIATAAAARPDARDRQSLRAVDFDTIIRAGGGTGVVPLLAEPPGVPSATGRTVRLIDVDDRGPAALRRDARRRRADYAAAGWFDGGVDPVEARAEAFVTDCIHRAVEVGKEAECPTP